MLTRVCHTKDWGTGVELTQHLLGSFSKLHLHHIFPKALLYKHGYSQAEVNDLANFTFLTQETNLAVSDRAPQDYLPEYSLKHPRCLETHWIPMHSDLWRVEHYREFLSARRELLAKAANEFLESLAAGEVPEMTSDPAFVELPTSTVMKHVAGEEENLLLECNVWVVDQGLPEGEFMYELADPKTGQAIAVLDLAWPNGLQDGYSQPVALLIDGGPETEAVANRAGYRFFTNADSFRSYVKQEILSGEPVAADALNTFET